MRKLLTVLIMFPCYSWALRTEVSPEEMIKIKSGEEIQRVEEIKGEVFPKVTLISLIPHSPIQNMKVFSDFSNHNKFIPNLKKSKVVTKNDKFVDVFFEMDMPIVSNTQYTTRHFIEYPDKDAILRWELVKSDQLKKTQGQIIFEAFEGKTLFTYTSHITPKSSLAWTVKSRVLPDVKETIQAVKDHLNKEAGK